MSTSMWPCGFRTYRIQTDDPKIARKLSRRKSMTPAGCGVNVYLRIFLIENIRPDNAKRMYRHIMGQETKMEAAIVESDVKSYSPVTIKQESLSLGL